ncbi:hypothetical protein V5799_014778 [Amblyomma americanum]|uniref:Uncharacterized protein n=1 Tax=Amblyomma americanum TaxID=6943 RepID=A0AAQ4E217_AMBAM
MQPSIFNEAFDHSPEGSAPEKKQLSEGLLGVGLLTVSDTTARTPESRRGDSDEDEEEWADHVMSKIRGRPIPPTPPASPRAMQSAVEVQGEPWEAPVVSRKENVESARDMSAERDAGADVMGDRSATQPQLQEFRRTADVTTLKHLVHTVGQPLEWVPSSWKLFILKTGGNEKH